VDAEFPRLANERHIFSGTIGLNLAEESLKTIVDRWLGNELRSGRLGIARAVLRFPLGRNGVAWNSCRCGLPDARHSSL